METKEKGLLEKIKNIKLKAGLAVIAVMNLPVTQVFAGDKKNLTLQNLTLHLQMIFRFLRTGQKEMELLIRQQKQCSKLEFLELLL